MKSIFTRCLSVGLLFGMALFAGCHDGAPGPAGQNGANGKDGGNGTGYNEAIKKGNIIVYLDGKTPSGIAFKDTVDYKFSNNDIDNNSYTYAYSDNDVSFDLKRFLSLTNTSFDDNAQFYMEPYQFSGDTTYYFELDLKANIALPDFTYFTISDSYYSTEGSNVTSADFKAFTYDPSNGRVKFRFDLLVPANSNSTGFDLRVSGEVNCLVYESEGD